jgi:NarL family two-component system sensor histidine kinase YdfH
MQLDAIDARLAEEDVQRSCEITRAATRQARAALDETRRIISALRAQQCQRNSLVQSVQAEIRRFRQVTGLLCRCDLRAFAMVPAHAGEHVLLAIKEGLSNIARHAHAHEVWIDLRNSGTRWVLEMRDDGCGFDPFFIAEGHYGLLGLRERVQQLDGEFSIQSAPGVGTRLLVSLPSGREEGEVCAL